jgi:hypothetical protein
MLHLPGQRHKGEKCQSKSCTFRSAIWFHGHNCFGVEEMPAGRQQKPPRAAELAAPGPRHRLDCRAALTFAPCGMIHAAQFVFNVICNVLACIFIGLFIYCSLNAPLHIDRLAHQPLGDPLEPSLRNLIKSTPCPPTTKLSVCNFFLK